MEDSLGLPAAVWGPGHHPPGGESRGQRPNSVSLNFLNILNSVNKTHFSSRKPKHDAARTNMEASDSWKALSSH